MLYINGLTIYVIPFNIFFQFLYRISLFANKISFHFIITTEKRYTENTIAYIFKYLCKIQYFENLLEYIC